MDFFSKIGKKASEAAQITKEKTAKLSGEIKLRNKINDCKNKINNLYEEIGKIVYAEYRSGAKNDTDEVNMKCEEIATLNEEIEKAEVEILALKDIKKCVSCGAEIALNVEFCSKCGKEQPKIETVEVTEEPTDVQEAEVTEVKDAEEDSAE
ncbi:MAG: zinc ribbon domain-containing protein [Clostridia bacterium]|nr:zinc ribbon domain-containing protein [Clostridia bacterium]